VAEARFDDLIHAPHRLRICAMLSQADGIEFSEIQRRTDLSKSALSKHLSQLGGAGYVSEKQIVRQGRSRMVLALTPAGRLAYQRHRASLQLLLEEGV
jgi:DNA-binding MarR family transcriptional regulator